MDCIALKHRTAKTKYLVEGEPTRKRRRTLMKHAAPNQPDSEGEGEAGLEEDDDDVMLDPELLVDWLDYTSELRDQRQANKSMDKAAVLFARRHPKHFEEKLKGDLERVGRTSLISGRPKLDVVAMLLHRSLMESLRLSRLLVMTLPFFTCTSMRHLRDGVSNCLRRRTIAL